MEIKQPFTLADLRKYPREILLAALIGLLIYFIERADKVSQENSRLNARIDTINTERLRLYDKVIFQGLIVKQLQEKDSVLKVNTQKYVNQILNDK